MSTEVLPSQLVGEGSAESDLTEQDLQTIVEQALQQILAGDRVLAIVPDKTRDDNTDLLFPFTADVLRARDVSQFDVLVAPLGTGRENVDHEIWRALHVGIGQDMALRCGNKEQVRLDDVPFRENHVEG